MQNCVMVVDGDMSAYRMDMGWLLVLLPYGDAWRRARKLFHSHVHQGVAHRYHPVQIDSARRFARDILTTKAVDEALSKAVRASLGRSIIQMVYGLDAQEADSEYLSLPAKVVDNINEAGTPGRFMVDFLPFCQYAHSWRSRTYC
jgi:cytochrome P450